MNCWEVKKCGRERGGKLADRHGVCPAYPKDGHRCARIARTYCGGKVQGSFAKKFLDCIKCDFYLSDHYDTGFRSL